MINKLKTILRDYAEDFFIGAGLVFINAATFRISVTAGLYCIGLSLVGVGVVLARMHVNRQGGGESINAIQKGH